MDIVILQSVFLSDIAKAYEKTANLESLLFDDFFNKGSIHYPVIDINTNPVYYAAVHKAQPGWRRVIAQAVLWGIPTPAFSTALAFFDGYRSEVVPANLIQAQVRWIQSLLESSLLISFSVITSVPIHSKCCLAKKTASSRRAMTSVRSLIAYTWHLS